MRPRASCFAAARWALLVTPWLGACSFFLDFDSLTRDHDKDSGTSSTGGTGSDASDGGGNGCPSSCDDDDACTDDTCQAGVCVHRRANRIVADGFSQTLQGPHLYRSALAAAKDRFFVAVFGELDNGQDIEFSRFDADGSVLQRGPRSRALADFNGDIPISPAALVVKSEDQTLVAYFAMGTGDVSVPANAGTVYRAEFDGQLSAAAPQAVAADRNYGFVDTTIGPAAAQVPNGDVFVVWQGAPPGNALGHGIFLQAGSTPLASGVVPEFSEIREIRGVSAIYGAGGGTSLGEPGAMWMATRANRQVDVQLQLHGNSLLQRLTFGQCSNMNVEGTSLISARSHLDGFWFAAWTKQNADDYTTELTAILCGQSSCVINPTCGKDQIELTGVRNPAVAIFHRTSDPTLVAHQALAFSSADPGAKTSAVGLIVSRIGLDGSDAGTVNDVIGSIELDHGDMTYGPDWPEVAVIPPDKVAVSWIKHTPVADELHLERHRICYAD